MHCLALTHLLISLAGSLTHRIISYPYVKAEQRPSEHILRKTTGVSPTALSHHEHAQGAGPSWKFALPLLNAMGWATGSCLFLASKYPHR